MTPTPEHSPSDFTDIVFEGPPSHELARFVEVEDSLGRSINFGEWVEREDGYWVLRIPANARLIAAAPDTKRDLDELVGAVRSLRQAIVDRFTDRTEDPFQDADDRKAELSWWASHLTPILARIQGRAGTEEE